MPARETQVKGLKELNKILEQLPIKLQKRAVRKALRAGSRPIIQKARSLAPVDTGALKKSIIYAQRRDPTRGAIGFLKSSVAGKGKQNTGSEKKRVPSKYAHLVEFGTSRAPAQPFMRPALDSAGNDAIKKITEVLIKEVEIEALRTSRSKVIIK